MGRSKVKGSKMLEVLLAKLGAGQSICVLTSREMEQDQEFSRPFAGPLLCTLNRAKVKLLQSQH